jgi:hypothetical protein
MSYFNDILGVILEDAHIEISHIGSDQESIEEALGVFAAAFPQHPLDEVRDFIMSSVNWDNSIKATSNGNTVGIYLIGDRQLSEVIDDEKAVPAEDLESYNHKTGVEGVALGVVPEVKGSGVGKKLKDALLSMTDADYIFGLQYKSLNNLQYWLKSRRVVAQSNSDEAVFITLQDIKLNEARPNSQSGVVSKPLNEAIRRLLNVIYQ